MKYTTFALFCLVFNLQLFCQVYIEQEINPVISTCGPIAKSQICIYNDSPFPIRDAMISISYEEGLRMTDIISDDNITLNKKPGKLEESLILLNLEPCSNICFTIFLEYECLAFTGKRNIEIRLHHNLNLIQTKATIIAFSPELELSTMEIDYDLVTNSFSRTFQLTNIGNIKIKDFVLKNKDRELITILTSSKAIITNNGEELIFGSKDFQTEGNKDIFFDPGEFIIIHQEIRIDKCFDNNPLAFEFLLHCNSRTCTYDVKSFQNNNLNISNAKLGYITKLLQTNSNCDTIVIEVKVFSRITKSKNSVTNAYQMSFDFGWLSNAYNGYYYYDGRIDFEEIIFNNRKYPLTINGVLFPFSCDVFKSDPDGPKGLRDLDHDGEFDDLLAGDTVHFILTARVNTGSFESDCRYNLIFPDHTFGIDFTSEDYCKQVYIDSSNRKLSGFFNITTFELQRKDLKASISFAGNYFKEGRDTLNLVVPHPYFPMCNNPKVRYTVNLPPEIKMDTTSGIISNMPSKLISVNDTGFVLEAFFGDRIRVVVNNTCSPNLKPTSIINDSTECYFCFVSTYPKLEIRFSAEFKCGEFCNDWIPLECQTKESFISICSDSVYQPKKEKGFIKADRFEVKRISYGFKDSTRTQYVNPVFDSLKLNSISQLDTFQILLKISPRCSSIRLNKFNFILNVDFGYNYDLKVTYFPFEFYDYLTYFYKNGSVFYKDTQALFKPIKRGNGINIFNEYKFDSSRLMNHIIFSNSVINQFDSLILVIVGRVSKDVPHGFNGDIYDIRGQLNSFEGNCPITEYLDKALYFSNRNLLPPSIKLGYNNFTNYFPIYEPRALICDSIELTNTFHYSHSIFADNEFPNEFRLPFLIDSIENSIPDYLKPYSFGKLTKYGSGVEQSRYLKNFSIGNLNKYTNINLNDKWKRTVFYLTTYLRPSCYVNIVDSIQTVTFAKHYIDKVDEVAVRYYNKLEYNLPGLILSSNFNRILFIKDSISSWDFKIETPENPHSSNKNLNDREHYYKFHNTWLYYEGSNHLNHPVSLELFLPGGVIKTILPLPMTNANSWIFKLDSVQKIIHCKMVVANMNCSSDSVKIILGNSCEGYPTDLKVVPKTCIDYAPQLNLILDPRSAVIECKPIHSREDFYVSECDTIHESLMISNLGLGYASKTVLHVKVPMGVKLTSCYANYTLSNPKQYSIPISFNPLISEYDIVLSPSVLSKLLPGFTELDSSSLELKMIFTLDCDLENGSNLNYRISYEEVCTKANSVFVNYEPKIFFKESSPSNNYSLDYSITKSNSCTKDFILNVGIIRLNSNFNKSDRITITYDKIMSFNSQAPIHSIGLKNNNYKYLIDNATESLAFELKDGLRKGDSVIIKIPMNSHCASNCKSTFLDLKLEELKTIQCSTSPLGRCDHYSVSKSVYFDDVKLYPDILIDSIEINYIDFNSGFIEFSSRIKVSSSSRMDLNQDLNFKIFHDKNSNGRFDNDDVLLDGISDDFHIVKDSIYILNTIHRVNESLACPLLVVLFKEDNPCLCYSDTFVVKSHLIENLSQKFELCANEDLILDFRTQLTKGIIITFDPNPYLTKLSENYFIFKKQMTSGTLGDNEELFYEIEISKLCHSRNKIEIFIDSDCIIENVDPKIYFPGVFSPNGDGINDNLVLVGTDQIEKILSIKIYNRWGVLVHSNYHLFAQDNFPLWNGEMNGKPLNPGVFTYIIQILTKDGRKLSLNGDITLLR